MNVSCGLKSCPEFARYMDEFRTRLRQALDENKWFLSEREGHDVGEQKATEDFLQNHFDRFAEQIRAGYCEHQCSRKEDCPLALFIRALPATAAALGRHQARGKTPDEAAEPPLTTPNPANKESAS